MIRKLGCAMVVMTVAIGFALADDFTAQITKIDGNKITYYKTKKGKKDGDAITMEFVKDGKVVKGKQDPDDKKKQIDGDAVDGGLKADVFSKASDDTPVTVRLFTDKDNKNIEKIRTFGKKGGK
jgi:major membrane immunogen (membrane-anchored lipoprotein)